MTCRKFRLVPHTRVFQESDPLSRLPLRYRERGWGIVSKFDGNILEVGLGVKAGEEADVLHVGHRALLN
jgi:hypothetical protein